MKKRLWTIPCVVLIVTACANFFGRDLFAVKRVETASATGNGEPVSIDPDVCYQTMSGGFSASDCWCGNFVGKYWNEPEKAQIAKWLFSQEDDADGSPEGIGLSMWRFNLGAGTEEQGEGSLITGNEGQKARRAETFWNGAGSYDWTKAAGQQYFLRKAKEYGVEQFVAFSNSPPVALTKNGYGHNKGGNDNANLKADAFDDFAVYMADVVEHFKNEGIVFNYISPVNEPQYKWDGTGQEGSPWQNSEVKKIVTELDKALRDRGLQAQTKILISEAAEWKYLYQSNSSRGYNQINEFFNPASGNYVGNLAAVPQVIGGHSYWNHGDNAGMKAARESVRVKADQFGLEVFQTEWSLLGDAGMQGIPGVDNASYMDIGLATAKIIYADLVYAGVSSWSYWTAMDVERWNHKDRFLLVGLAPGVKEYEKDTILKYQITQPGAVKDYPSLWALGNYSRFIRPGYIRIKMDGMDNPAGLMGTAFKSPAGDTIVLVFVNMSTSSSELKADFADGTMALPANIRRYLTDENHSLTLIPDNTDSFLIPPRSVLSVVYDL